MSAKNLDKKNRWRSVTVAFRVSPEEAYRLNMVAKTSGLTKQDYILKQLLKEEVIETETNAVVYHIIKTYTTIGCMLSVFYVSADESEWESDREDMKTGEQLCYVKNIENEDCREFGYICFKKSFGGLMRTA